MKPVVYSAASQALVDAFNSLPKDQKSGAYWSDPAIAKLKKEIKDHYISEQAHQCAYCKHTILTNNNGVWDGEHIISKQKNPEFMFEPQNLAISCKDCNLAKWEDEVRKTKKASFPILSEEYIIVHPHFDNYDEHIGWMDEVCFPRSLDKGLATIAMCNLARYAAMKIGVKENIMDDRFTRLAGAMMNVKDDVDVDIVAEGIKALLRARKANP